MSPAERNYKIYDKELLVIVKVLDKWQQYLLDIVEKFEVWTDHENLKYFKEPHKLNGQQARWYLKLQDYDFTLWHIPEKTNTNCPEKRKWIQKKTIKTYRCSKKSYGYDKQQFKMEYLLYYLDKNIYK